MLQHWRNIIILTSHFAWLLVLPIWGPALTSLTTGDSAFYLMGLAFILVCVVAYLILPFRVDQERLSHQARLWAFLLIPINALFFISGDSLWPLLAGIAGIGSVIIVFYWFFDLRRSVQTPARLEVLALSMIGANLFLLLFLLLHHFLGRSALLVATSLPLAVTAWALIQPRNQAKIDPPATQDTPPISYVLGFIFLFCFAASTVVQLIYSGFHVDIGLFYHFYSLFPYMLAIGVIYYLKSVSILPMIASILLGISLVSSYAFLQPLTRYLVTIPLTMGALGLIDLFLWTFLTRLPFADGQAQIWFGRGLAVDLSAKSVGSLLARYLESPSYSTIAPALGTIALFLAFIPISLLARARKQTLAVASLEHSAAQENSEELADLLTKRESEVLSLLIQGLSNDEIAQEIHVTVATVRSHLRSIYRKTGFHNRVALMSYIITGDSGEHVNQQSDETREPRS